MSVSVPWSGHSSAPAQQLDEQRKTQSRETNRVCALECASWLPTVLPDIALPPTDATPDEKYEYFFNSLTSGVILCRLVAAATKGAVAPKFKDTKAGSFIARDNVTNALSALRSPPLSLRPEVVCEADDLVDRKNERAFINMLLMFSKICMIKYGTEAPSMVKFELEIDEEHHGIQEGTEGAEGEKKGPSLTTDGSSGKDAAGEDVEEEHTWVPPPTPKKKTSTVTESDAAAPAATESSASTAAPIITTTPPTGAAAAPSAAAPAEAASASSLAAPGASGNRSRTPSASTPGHHHQLSSSAGPHPPSDTDLAIASVLEDHDWLWLVVKKIQILNKQKRKAAARGGKGEYRFGVSGGKVAVRIVQGVAMVREKNEWIDLVTYLKEKIIPHEKH